MLPRFLPKTENQMEEKMEIETQTGSTYVGVYGDSGFQKFRGPCLSVPIVMTITDLAYRN